MLGPQRRGQGEDRVGAFIMGTDEMVLGWGKAVQVVKSGVPGARCLSSCPSSATTWLSNFG